MSATDQTLNFLHYEVLNRPDGTPQILGKGAMGVTYKAFDQNLHSFVVVKVINPSLLSEDTVKGRFLQEAKAMASMRHLHIAGVYHLENSEKGLFYAMEFCDGPTVQEYVAKQGQLKVEEAMELTRQAADALAELENKGLLHRDIKPANIILVKDARDRPQVKLIDFGLARSSNKEENDPNLTKGGFVGTPSFASPEQLQQQENLDIRSDIYSLGVTLWFMLCGKPPFVGSQFEVMYNHVNTQPPWNKLPSLPEKALEIIRKTLAKSPWQRYQHAADLLTAIEQFQQEEKFGAPAVPEQPVWGWDQFNRGGASVIGTASYEILADYGDGELGKHFLGRDLLVGEFLVVCYLSPAILASRAAIERLQTITRRLSRFRHPHLVAFRALEAGRDGMKLIWEWMEGVTLADFLRKRAPMNLKEALPLLSQLAAGMDAAIRHDAALVRTNEEEIWLVLGSAPNTGANIASFCQSQLGEGGDFALKLSPLSIKTPPGPATEERSAPQLVQEFARLILVTAAGANSEARVMIEEARRAKTLPGEFPCAKLLEQVCKTEGVEWSAESQPAIVTQPGVAPVPTGGTQQWPTAGGAPFGAVPTQMRGLPTGSIAGSQAFGSAIRSSVSSRGPLTASGRTSEISFDSKGLPRVSTGQLNSQNQDKRAELERRRMQLEAEQERLKVEEYLNEQQSILEDERRELAEQRDQLLRMEEEVARQAEEERAKLEEERRELDARDAQLEIKRKEEEALQKSLSAKAQAELRRLDEERQAMEKSWQAREAEQLAALQAKEAELKREQEESRRRLEQEHAGLTASVQALEEQRLAAEAAAREAAERERSELQEERARLERQLADMERERGEQSRELESVRAELDQAMREFEARRQSFEEDQNTLRRQQQEDQDNRARLEEEQRKLEQEREALEQRREAEEREREASFARAQAQIQSEREELEARRREITEENNRRLHEQEAEQRERRESLEKERMALQARQDEWENSRREREAEAERLSAERGAALAARERELSELAADQSRSAAEVEAARQAVEQARREVDTQGRQIEGQRSQEEEFARQLRETSEALAAQERQLQEAQAREKAEIEAARRDSLLELQSKEAEVQSHLQALENEREALRASHLQQQARLESEFARRTTELEGEMSRLQAQAQAREIQIQEREKALEAEWKALETARAESKPETSAQEAQLEEARQALMEKERQLEERRLSAQREQEAEWQQRREQVQNEEAALQSRREEMERQQQAMHAELLRQNAEAARREEERRHQEEEEHRASVEKRQREFSRLEEEQNARLEKLQQEIAAQEAALQQQRDEMAGQSRLTNAMQQEAGLDREDMLEELTRRQKTLDEQSQSLEVKLVALKKAQKRRVWVIAAGVLLMGITAYTVGGRILRPADTDYETLWNKLRTERQVLMATGKWTEVLDNVLYSSAGAFEDKLKPDQPNAAKVRAFLQNKRAELVADAGKSVQALNAQIQTPEQAAAAVQGDGRLIRNLDSLVTWDLPQERVLLWAKLKMPAMDAANNAAEALRAYATAITTNPAYAAGLRDELQATTEVLLKDFQDDRAVSNAAEVSAALAKLPDSSKTDAPRLRLFEGEMAAEAARLQKDYAAALSHILATVRQNPEWSEELRDDVTDVIRSLAAMDAETLRKLSSPLTTAGQIWKMEQPFMILAKASDSNNQRLDYYRFAEQFGNMEARAEVGRFEYEMGFQSKSPDEKEKLGREGFRKLEESANAGVAKAQYLLADLYFSGHGIPEDLPKAADYAGKAVAQNFEKALPLLAKARLGLAEKHADKSKAKELYEQTRESLAKLRELNLPEEAHLSYLAAWNPVMQDRQTAWDALTRGAARQEVNCLFAKAQWLETGTPPAVQNISEARDLYAAAAGLGHAKAVLWCKEYAASIVKKAKPADLEWMKNNQAKWAPK